MDGRLANLYRQDADRKKMGIVCGCRFQIRKEAVAKLAPEKMSSGAF